MDYSGSQNDRSSKYAKPAGALLGVGGAIGIKKSVPYITGRRSFWHGTSGEHSEKILSGQGIRPSAKTGAEGVLSTPKFIGEGHKFPQQWRNYAYVSESPFKSGTYSIQSAILTQSRPKLLRVSARDWGGGKYGPKLIENPETAGGSQVMAKRVAENYTGIAKRIIEKNPEMIQSAHKMQMSGKEHAVPGISARRIVGAKGYQKLTAGEILKYAKARPLRFLGGVGGAAIGTGAIIGGGALARHKRNSPTTKNLRLNNILDDLIQFAWRRPFILRPKNKADFNYLADLFNTGQTAASGGLAMSPSTASKKGHYRDFNVRNRRLSETVRKGGLIIAPSETSSLARLEKMSARGAYKTQKDAASTVLQHELIHSLREPMNYSKEARRAMAGGKGYLHTLKEEAIVNYATLLGKRGKKLGTPFLKRLGHAARLTATYLKPSVRKFSAARNLFDKVKEIQFSVSAARAIASGRLPIASAGKLQGVWNTERFIKNVGKGGTQTADLVLHPSFGVAVRKHANTGIINASKVSVSAKHLMEAQKKLGSSGFAKVHSVEPGGLSYHEYVPGPTMSEGKERSWNYVVDQLEKLKKTSWGHKFTPSPKDLTAHRKFKYDPKWGSKPSVSYVREQRLLKARHSLSHKGIPPTPEQSVMIKHLAGKGLEVDDLHRRNIIGGKAIDYTIEDPANPTEWTQISTQGDKPGYRIFKKRSEKRLSSLLGDLIQFKTLYQPGEKDEPPETLPELKGVVDYTVQRHDAKRAGPHRDIRIGTRRHGLFSWATRKDLPSEADHIGIHPQPVHPHSYLGWEGDIPSGYGAGKVSTEHLGKALITKSTPTEVHATLAGQKEHHRMAFLKTARGWLLTRGKHPEPPREAQKPKYKSVSQEEAPGHLESLEPGSIVQPKIDGALVYVTTKGNRPEVFSHRKSKVSNKNIIHTERFFHGRPTTNIPKEHQRTLLGELYGTRGGKAIEPQELGGILNTHLGESIQKQKSRGVKLKIMPFDYANGKGESYPDRLAKVKETVRHLPKGQFHTPEEATTPGAARRLFDKIRHGRHPLTKEGVIIHPPEGKMIKIKNTSEDNVKITGTYPGTGKFEGSHGGFTYEGGRVGTGFTDETRRRLHEYIGRIARIKHQGQYKTGAHRAPSFIAVEENK